MLTLIKHELFKLFKRVKTLVVVIGFILLTGVMAYGFHHDAENMKKYNTPEFKIANLEENIKYIEQDKNSIPPDIKNDQAKAAEYVEDMEENILQMKNEIVRLKALNGKEEDWRESLNSRIQEVETMLKQDQRMSQQSKGEMTQELEHLKYLKAHDIKPTQYYDFNAFIFIEKLVMVLGQVFLVIGLAMFVSDMVSGECTPPTLKLLLTQPVSRGKVIFSKFISVTIAAVGSILVLEALAFVVVGLLYGFGDSTYPVMVGAKYQFDPSVFLEGGGHPLALIAGSSHIVPIWQYTLNMLLVQGLFIIACTSFAFLISTLFKSSMVSMGVSSVSLIAMTIVFSLIGALKKFSIYVFTSYMDMGAIIKGTTAGMFNNPNSTLGFTALVFIGWTVVCYLISHFVFTKKDILI
jgi:ABC-2 type transport system permease protein